MWRQADGFKAKSRVSTWILAIARHKALSALRSRPEQHLDERAANAIADSADDAETITEQQDRGMIVRKCLSQLSAIHREVLDLVYYHEKSIKEVAQIVGVPAEYRQDAHVLCAQTYGKSAGDGRCGSAVSKSHLVVAVEREQNAVPSEHPAGAAALRAVRRSHEAASQGTPARAAPGAAILSMPAMRSRCYPRGGGRALEGPLLDRPGPFPACGALPA